MITKSGLAIILSKLEDFKEHSIELEQYSTPSEIAADMLWKAFLKGDIEGKTILDAASGPGFLGLGALLLGAKKVYFVDMSKDAIEISKRNYDMLKKEWEIGKAVFVCSSIEEFDKKADVVVQNPPFGVKKKHADRAFLVKAMELSNVVYSFHKVESRDFINRLSMDNGFVITHFWGYDFALKQTQKFHKRRIHRIKVGCWRLEKPAGKGM